MKASLSPAAPATPRLCHQLLNMLLLQSLLLITRARATMSLSSSLSLSKKYTPS